MTYTNSQGNTLLLICVILVLALLSGCARQLENTGNIANDEGADVQRLADAQEGLWRTDDVLVNYTVRQADNRYTLSGSFTIADKLYRSFPIADYFYLYINYLDENNRVVSSYDVTPSFRLEYGFKNTFTLRPVPQAPPEAVAFIFSYWGSFRSNSSEGEGGSDWEIFYSPFLRKI